MKNAEGRLTTHNIPGGRRHARSGRVVSRLTRTALAAVLVWMLVPVDATAQSRTRSSDRDDRSFIDPNTRGSGIGAWTDDDFQSSRRLRDDQGRSSTRRDRDDRSTRNTPPPSGNQGGSGVAEEAQVVTGNQNPAAPVPLIPNQANAQPNIRSVNNNALRFQNQRAQQQPGQGNQGQQPVQQGFPTFLFQPVELNVTQGDVFEVDLALSNTKPESFDELLAAVQYDPKYLELLPAEENAGAATIVEATEGGFEFDRSPGSGFLNDADPLSGVVYFGGPVKGTESTATGPFATIRFRALLPNSSPSKLRYLFPGAVRDTNDYKTLTTLALEGKDILGIDIGQGGAVSADVRIESDAKEKGPVVRTRTGEDVAVPESGEYPTLLMFIPDKRQVKVGEEFSVAVLFYNPQGAAVPFDEISLLIHYDPASLEVTSLDRLVDDRTSNRLQVDAGDFRFDQMEKNRVDPENGLISFRARATRSSLTASGRVMTLRFKALTPVEETRLKFGVNKHFGHPTTGVFEGNQDRLANPLLPGDGIFTSSVAIVPPAEG